MRRPFTPIAGALALCATLLAPQLSAQGGDSPWGLRNILKTPQLSSWTVNEFQTEFAPHQAGHLAFWLFWSEVEASENVYDTTELDRGITLVDSVAGNPVIVFQLAARPPAPGGFWAMNSGNPYTGPKDLLTGATPVWPTGLAKGYSDTLYDAVALVANRIADTYSGTVLMRFHNEAWDLWSLGGADSWNANLDNYLRSYLTFRQAIEDVEGTTSNSNVAFEIGHGSLPRGRLLPYKLHQIGLANPEARATIVQWLDAYTERNRCVIGNAYGINMPISSWSEAVAYAGPQSPRNRQLDAWMERQIAWTAAGYFEFTTAHPHGKPRFIELEQFYFDAAVSGAGGTPPRWVAAECAFELLDQKNWGVIPCPGAALDQFVAEDYARKWCTLVASGTAFCSPILGGPHPQYIGLYQPTGTPGAATGCSGPSSCPTLPAPTDCVINLCRFPSNDAFQFLSAEIGAPEAVATVKKNSGFVHYRFSRASQSKYVDVLWRRDLFDAATPSANAGFFGPDGYTNAAVYDVFGTLLSTHSNLGELVVPALGQAPRVVVWTP